MNKLLGHLLSMKTAVVLMLLFAVSIGVATFIENDFGTLTARAEVYNAKWFELLLAVLALILVANIIRFRMYRREKWLAFLFHLAFLVILVGAAVTRYVGFEGIMHIREGETTNMIISEKAYLQVRGELGGQPFEFEKPLLLSKISGNSFEEEVVVGNRSLQIALKEYIPDARREIVEDPNGAPIVSLMVASGSDSSAVVLQEGEHYLGGALPVVFGKEGKLAPALEIVQREERLYIKSPVSMSIMAMADKSAQEAPAGSWVLLEKGRLYAAGDMNLVLKNYYPKASLKIVPNNTKSPGMMAQNDALVLMLRTQGESREVVLFGQAGAVGEPKSIQMKDAKLDLVYGSKPLSLPFALKLVDFQLERYPGSMSPSSYASEVVLLDSQEGIEEPFRIYMNNVLDYKGYRFFQSSFDRDEMGTILSVNHDPGTLITYIGYFMLALGMFAIFFSPRGRFQRLSRAVKKVQLERENVAASAIVGLALMFLPSVYAAGPNEEILKTIKGFDAEHASKFGKLLVQDSGGRIKPIDTLSREIISKVAKTDSIIGLDPNQIVLGMTVKPKLWQDVRMIRVSHPEINKILGVEKERRYFTFNEFFDFKQESSYKLAKYVDEAARKKPSLQNKLDKELIKVDERLNICFMVYTGELLRIYPKPGDKNQKWYAPIAAISEFDTKESELVRLVTASYFYNIDQALKDGNWTRADQALGVIQDYQNFYGASIIPEKTRIDAELLYNKANIFEKLFFYYAIIGTILLLLAMAKILKPGLNVEIATKIALYLMILGFVLHTAGLGLRWYVAQHAPWSDGYESMIYIAWATVLAGFIFSKNSPITLAATGILSGLILFVAHLSWMDPQITNLVPVLKSYWLTIHVSMITASYGFLGLGALLAFISLFLFAIKKESNRIYIEKTIKELTYINEMSLIIGLMLLTIGNFIGGVWANESWGRYWGWDPKETWALVTILVYAAVIHMRYIPGLVTFYLFNVAALLAFSSVIMTYFGVNFYLAGLHSYAKGDPVPIPDFVYYTIAVVALLVVAAYRNRRMEKNK